MRCNYDWAPWFLRVLNLDREMPVELERAWAMLLTRHGDAGAEVFHPLEDQDYGSRDFSIKDPEGNIWSFGTYAGEG